MTSPIYAIGDRHGRVDEFDRALSLIERDGGTDAEIVFIGDYVDLALTVAAFWNG